MVAILHMGKMEFYNLTSFTPNFVQALVKEEGLDFPVTYFQESERIFGRELDDPSWLGKLYRSSFNLAKGHGFPPRMFFWPPRSELKAFLERMPLHGDGEGMKKFVVERFPEGEMLLQLGILVWLRGKVRNVVEAAAVLQERLYLGHRILEALPVVDRNLSVRLEESDFRESLKGDLWPLCVGFMGILMQGQDQFGTELRVTARDYVGLLAHAPMSLWKDMAESVRKYKGLVKMASGQGSLEAEHGGVALGSSGKRFVFREESAPVRGPFEDMGVLGVPGYILQGMGYGPVLEEEFSAYGDYYSRLKASEKEDVERKSVQMLVLNYMSVVARYGFLAGFLDRQARSDVGVLRAHLKGYGYAFESELRRVIDEGLWDSPLVRGSCVYRLALGSKLWPFFFYERSMTQSMGLGWGLQCSLVAELDRIEKGDMAVDVSRGELVNSREMEVGD
jgi:hypothetical protein